MWLSHHDPSGYDRCVLVAGRQVCRRCLVLYPLAFVVLVVAQVSGWSGSSEALALVALPLPAVIEFVLEHRGVIRYSPIRQMLVTIPLAVALGAGFDRYLDRPGDVLFWSVVVGYTALCLWSAMAGRAR
ncbi:MAG TPA: hypothetical protein VJS45_15055 [Acidimicrobiia bacterium]|nr:hypothetical protein [Acidimicrobiia bacterium]